MRVFFCYHPPSIPLMRISFSCWVLVFGYLISWIKMLIFVNFFFFFSSVYYYWVKKNSFIPLGFFLLLLLYDSSEFLSSKPWFLIGERVPTVLREREKKNTTQIHIRMNGLWMRVKNIRRISNVRKLSISDVDQQQSKKKKHRKSARRKHNATNTLGKMN